MSARQHTGLLALLLTFVAGFVDIVGWLFLSHLYTANMSGNTLAVGLGMARGEWHHALRFFFPIAFFMAGLLACGAIQESATRRHAGRPVLFLTLVPEAALLAFLLIGGPHHGPLTSVPRLSPALFYVFAGTTAFAMGLQNGSLTRIAGQTVRTTHVTGSLVTLSEALVRYGFRRREVRRAPRGEREAAREKAGADASLDVVRLMTLQWLSYALGALIGVLLADRFAVRCLLLPIALLFIISAADALSPVSSPSHTVVRRRRLDRRQQSPAGQTH